MFRPRVIPCLLLRGSGLVKTVKFKAPTYLGDPRNIIRIFNDKQVDELIVLDIMATRENREPSFALLKELTSECFMPVAYGGGICSVSQAEAVLRLGVEKIAVNSMAIERPQLMTDMAKAFGSQSVVASIDVKRSLFGQYEVVTRGGTFRTGAAPIEFARRMEDAGVGEILLNSVDRDGMMTGYDVDLIKTVSSAVRVPVVACGGAGEQRHLRAAVVDGGAAAAAAGSLFVFHGPHRAVLVSFPSLIERQRVFA